MEYLRSLLEMLIKYKDLYIKGIEITLLVSLTGTVFGLFIGLILAYFRDRREGSGLLRNTAATLSSIYVEVVRGTPMIVQGVFIYYGLYKYLQWTPIVAGIFIVSMNTAAYMAEILRSGIQSIDVGQTEAGKSLGMKDSQIFRFIILPQAIRNSFPSIGNEFVVNLKDTSVLNAIALSELFFQGMSIAGATFDFSKSMLIIAVIYFILTYTVTRLLRYIEKRMNLPRRELGSQSIPMV